ncbi:MAG: TAT-variant-translocated molybdopterin oxidoreductase [Ignavibacteriaceae bacterium]|nr:TAT-variant-translocated molybdopterin oxidoreductase [Ignavibacteriaceae bacterium]
MSDNFNNNDINQNSDPNYWRSFEELYKDEKTLKAKHDEFKEGVTDNFEVNKDLSGLSRRKFLALLGASAALAGAGCSDYRDKGEIVPYNKRPEEITLGKANYYSSTCMGCEYSCGILIKTREGRPIKVDGNPDHPVSKGKICSKGQASILDLYDPSRIQTPLIRRGSSFLSSDWKTVDEEILKVLNENSDKEIALVTHTIVSPTLLNLINEFKVKYPTTVVYSYELFNNSIKNSAWKKCYNQDSFPLIKWNEANIILSLEGDFLGVDGNKIENVRLYSEKRDVMKSTDFNRLYTVEGNLSLTGMNSDYRLRLKPDLQYDFVLSLLNEIVLVKKASKLSIDSNALTELNKFSLTSFIQKNKFDKKVIDSLVNDLVANKGNAIVYSGRTLNEEVHIAVNLLNEVLGNTSLYRDDASSQASSGANLTALSELVEKLKKGVVKAVIHFDTNTLYHLSSVTNVEDSFKKAVNITFAQTVNETTAISNFVLPTNHNFESWGDAKVRNGFYSLVQPVIAPLYNTRQKEAVLLGWVSDKSAGYSETQYLEYIKEYWNKNIYSKVNSLLSFDRYWYGVLHDGVAKVAETVSQSFSFNTIAYSHLKSETKSNSGFTVLLQESYTLGDGRYANNGWLQELPHPVTKVTWDNYAAISESSAKKLSLKTDDLIEVNAGGKKIKLPILVQPGVADDLIAIELGYGRKNSPVVANEVGFNANELLNLSSAKSPWLIVGATVSKVGGTYKVVSTQDHHSYDDSLIQDIHLKRAIIQEGTVEQYKSNPEFLHTKKHNLINIYKDFEYKDVKWAMSIDLNKCLGCGDCVVACNVENNIPVVGKDQVALGREMNWLRIDRYYSGTPENPKVSIQPMLCQHCDHAPCENVCPVVATTHSDDGLNQMVYNRCVGTRYCSNNCPYKVRRYNFFDFRDHFRKGYQKEASLELLVNPEVTLRGRGVMEKCTFCVQRIMDARQEATNNNTKIKGTDVQTACQQACGTEAIIFGDMNDVESKLSKYRNHELGYVVLEELNVKPNVTYIAKLRNTFPEEV